ncbi:MAG: GIY-YIG nuclease family protein [Chthoniobacteraceae bacterium]|nr:GIY-YIG nuclease family protein [Chthoniobacteraceae bacterium]
MKDLFVYLMANASRVVLYTGVTNNLQRRVWEHRNQCMEGFTKRYHVNRLVYYEVYPDPNAAIAREKEIKGWRRAKKDALVASMNPRWEDLAPKLFPDN